ncbi:hypothetical protein D9758_012540 [Tetrapyrgos nigripes]|uniref:Uncharacterized protein n=1 Tax=Tetrapyrgos nigripes TaxID=182062 RepID=A0A8H5G338_9AGAR|nr:hypothetical protein D9758_012540 [Tetrapyrgos nigripes]
MRTSSFFLIGIQNHSPFTTLGPFPVETSQAAPPPTPTSIPDPPVPTPPEVPRPEPVETHSPEHLTPAAPSRTTSTAAASITNSSSGQTFSESPSSSSSSSQISTGKQSLISHDSKTSIVADSSSVLNSAFSISLSTSITTETSTTTITKSPSSIKMTTILASVLGSTVLFLGVIISIFICRRRRRAKRPQKLDARMSAGIQKLLFPSRGTDHSTSSMRSISPFVITSTRGSSTVASQAKSRSNNLADFDSDGNESGSSDSSRQPEDRGRSAIVGPQKRGDRERDVIADDDQTPGTSSSSQPVSTETPWAVRHEDSGIRILQPRSCAERGREGNDTLVAAIIDLPPEYTFA